MKGLIPSRLPKDGYIWHTESRACAAGLRYVLYLYMTSLDDPRKVIAQPGGYFMAPVGEERTGDVSNVLFSNDGSLDEDGTVYIY